MRKNNTRRDRLMNLMKAHGLKLNGLSDTSKNAMAILDKHGVCYKNEATIERKCLICETVFATVFTNKQGRDKKYCSDDCRSRRNVASRRLNSDLRPCKYCGVDFDPLAKRGRASEYCSLTCKTAWKKAWKKSDVQKAKTRERLDAAKIKNREKTKQKIRVCKRCSINHQRVNSWYCSESCRIESRIDAKKAYYQLPQVIEKRREADKRDERKAKKNERSKPRLKQRRIDDPMYLAKERIRCRTKAAFLGQGFTKGCKTREMLGCSWDQFKSHIEKQFTKGMKWSNRHLWHIDHIIPLASANTVEELEKLSHFSNLRPLWAAENIQKRDKIVDCQPELCIKL